MADNVRFVKENAAMSFREIGEALGITEQGAYFHYTSAIRKLKKRPLLLHRLHELCEFRRKVMRVNYYAELEREA